jgi:hypothetical protein
MSFALDVERTMKRVRRQTNARLGLLATLCVIVVVGQSVFRSKPGDAMPWMPPLFATFMMTGILLWVRKRTLRREEQVAGSFRLAIGPTAVRRVAAGYPPLELRQEDIADIKDHEASAW